MNRLLRWAGRGLTRPWDGPVYQVLQMLAAAGRLERREHLLYQLLDLVRAPHSYIESLNPRPKSSMEVILACPELPDWFVVELDILLASEGLTGWRERLAAHPSAWVLRDVHYGAEIIGYAEGRAIAARFAEEHRLPGVGAFGGWGRMYATSGERLITLMPEFRRCWYARLDPGVRKRDQWCLVIHKLGGEVLYAG